jgi:hypothetical protein
VGVNVDVIGDGDGDGDGSAPKVAWIDAFISSPSTTHVNANDYVNVNVNVV